MSKTTLRKVIKEFEAPELRELLIDIYTKSKEARELLDFFAEPDIEKKSEQYRAVLSKEARRYTRRAYHPRIARLRSTIKKFKTFEPGNEAVAELMLHTMTELLSIGRENWLRETLYVQIRKFVGETLDFISENGLLDEFMPRIRKLVDGIKDVGASVNPLRRIMDSELKRIGNQD